MTEDKSEKVETPAQDDAHAAPGVVEAQAKAEPEGIKFARMAGFCEGEIYLLKNMPFKLSTYGRSRLILEPLPGFTNPRWQAAIEDKNILKVGGA